MVTDEKADKDRPSTRTIVGARIEKIKVGLHELRKKIIVFYAEST